MAQSHTGHLTGSDAVTERGVPPVRRDARRRPRRAARRVGRARAHPPREDPGVGAGARRARASACTRSRAAPARTWPTCSPTPGLRLPDLTKATQTALHDGLIPAYLRVSNPVDCGGPPVADRARPQDPRRDPRRQERRHPRSCRSPARSRCSASRSPATSSRRRRRPTKPIFVIWGAPSGTDDTYYKRLLDGGLPTFRTFNNCVAAVKATPTTGRSPRATARRSTTRPPTPLPGGEEGAQAARRLEAGRGALGVELEEAAPARTASRRRKDELCASARSRANAAEGDRLPRGDEGLVARPAAQDRRRRSCASASARAEEVRAAYDDLLAQGHAGRQARRASKACWCARW